MLRAVNFLRPIEVDYGRVGARRGLGLLPRALQRPLRTLPPGSLPAAAPSAGLHSSLWVYRGNCRSAIAGRGVRLDVAGVLPPQLRGGLVLRAVRGPRAALPLPGRLLAGLRLRAGLARGGVLLPPRLRLGAGAAIRGGHERWQGVLLIREGVRENDGIKLLNLLGEGRADLGVELYAGTLERLVLVELGAAPAVELYAGALERLVLPGV
mmetsp:Transcript_61294/g.179127  ORF Transcript_61294/g.179127 Transcript_61294/m.179127 type:complete len:210 (-) Transcript_61294:498-1127(-)